MEQKETIAPDRVYRLWESTQDIIDFTTWLPEVVGTEAELTRIGSTLVAKLPDADEPTDVEVKVEVEVTEPLRFIDADVSRYRKALNFFRKRHHIKK